MALEAHNVECEDRIFHFAFFHGSFRTGTGPVGLVVGTGPVPERRGIATALNIIQSGGGALGDNAAAVHYAVAILCSKEKNINRDNIKTMPLKDILSV